MSNFHQKDILTVKICRENMMFLLLYYFRAPLFVPKEIVRLEFMQIGNINCFIGFAIEIF